MPFLIKRISSASGLPATSGLRTAISTLSGAFSFHELIHSAQLSTYPEYTTPFLTMATATTPVVVNAAPQQITRWADANSVTFTGRVFNAELVQGRYGEFVALDIITRPVQDDDDSQVVIHLNSNNLVAFFKADGIPTGRVSR